MAPTTKSQAGSQPGRARAARGGSGLPPGPALPAAASTLAWMFRPIELMEACGKRYGEPYTMRLFGFPPIVVVHTPESVKQIFTDDGETYAAGRFNQSLAPLLGDKSVLMLDGAEHLRHRRLLLPPFHGERMQRYGEAMLALTDACIDRWPIGERFPLHPDMQDATLSVILRTVFGFEAGPRYEEFKRRMKKILALGSSPLLLVPAVRKDLGPRSPWGAFRRALAAGDEYLLAEIAERRRTGYRSDDILSLLLDARDEAGEPMSDAELRDELVTLLVAGHETTATALTWAVRWTLATPGLPARLRKEIREACAAAGVTQLDAKLAAELPLVDAIAREALRLNPVIPLVGRIAEKPVHLAGYDLPAGTPIVCSIVLAHRRPEVYPDPLRFDPDRFLHKKFTPSELFPFGGGTRRCIGMAFALYEMRVVLARIFERTSLTLAPTKPIRVQRRSITLMPSDGLFVRLDAPPSNRARSTSGGASTNGAHG
ncbi:MAG: cytochrome P450 [Deltaproteobacteria bacterium]|nr:cytochrome P450 [Deltaproteobacteria bacterium]